MNSDFLNKVSRVDFINGFYVKRNDLLKIYSSNGGKAQGAYNLIMNGRCGFQSIVTLGSRHSPQCDIVSDICSNEGIECHLFMPSGPDTEVIRRISSRNGCFIHRVPYGYTSNLIYKANCFVKEYGSFLIPFGMKCTENIDLISKQCANIPLNVDRIVVPIGSGVTFCGVLKGLMDFKRFNVKVLGVETGADSSKFIANNLPFMNEISFDIKIYREDLSPSKRYEAKSYRSIGNGLKLNPLYEGKCFDFLQQGDLMWIVGS